MGDVIMLLEIDYALFWFFNVFVSNPFFDLIVPHITSERNLMFVYYVASATHIAMSKNKLDGLKRVIIASLVLGAADASGHRIIKPFFDRYRPSHSMFFVNDVHIMFPEINFLLGRRSSLSFMSNHAITNAALATVWTLWFPKAGYVLVPLAVFIAYTRVYVGVHYPFDLFFGLIYGFFVGWLGYRLTRRFFVKKENTKENAKEEQKP